MSKKDAVEEIIEEGKEDVVQEEPKEQKQIEPEKPTEVRIVEVKMKIMDICNQSRLPVSVVSLILESMSTEVKKGVDQSVQEYYMKNMNR